MAREEGGREGYDTEMLKERGVMNLWIGKNGQEKKKGIGN